jgi:hypothetical protein
MADTSTLSLRANRTRNHLADLIDSLQDRMTPVEIMSQLAGRWPEDGRGPGFTQTIAAEVSRNPLACMLIAAGIGWLMFSEAERRRPSQRARASTRPRRKRTVARRAPSQRRSPNNKSA